MKRVHGSAVVILSVRGAGAAVAQDDAKDPGQIGRHGEPTHRKGPREFLSAFNGLNIQGDWVLTVTDGGGGDQGTLNAWCVITTPIPIELIDFEIE